MADGTVHFKYYKLGLIAAIPIGLTAFGLLLFLGHVNSYVFILSYFVSYAIGAVLDPDADQWSLTQGEGRVLRTTRRFTFIIGFFGALWVSYWFMYAWFVSLFGGHRSWISHGFIIGTVIRIIFFNVIIGAILIAVFSYGVINFGWSSITYELYLDVWVSPYLLGQFLAWFISDGIHLMLDTEYAKGRLY